MTKISSLHKHCHTRVGIQKPRSLLYNAEGAATRLESPGLRFHHDFQGDEKDDTTL